MATVQQLDAFGGKMRRVKERGRDFCQWVFGGCRVPLTPDAVRQVKMLTPDSKQLHDAPDGAWSDGFKDVAAKPPSDA